MTSQCVLVRFERWIRKATRARAHHKPNRPGTHTYVRKHMRTLTLHNTYCFSTPTMIYELASILRYTYIARKLHRIHTVDEGIVIPDFKCLKGL